MKVIEFTDFEHNLCDVVLGLRRTNLKSFKYANFIVANFNE